MEKLFENQNVKVVLANAGSGKTRYAIEDCILQLNKYLPQEIAFVTFTKRGVVEGVRRIVERTKYNTDDFVYFKTIHALSFYALGLKHENVFTEAHEKRFNAFYGFNLNRFQKTRTSPLDAKDNVYLDLYDLLRAKVISRKDVFEKEMGFDEGYFRHLVLCYNNYKDLYSLVDFYDCLINYTQGGVSLPCKVAYIDEAQDLTYLQWAVLHKAFRNAEEVIILGDDKQAIYSFAGAQPSILIELSKRFPIEHLSKCYRLPRKVYDLSIAITKMISEKTEQKAEFLRENSEGGVFYLDGLDRLKNKIGLGETWYLLSRNKIFLEKAQNFLHENLIPYWTEDGFFINQKDMVKLKDYFGFRLKGYKNEEAKQKFKEKYNIKSFDDDFTESDLFLYEKKYTIYSYVEKWGLDNLIKISKGQEIILLSTIHHVKGGEADNVVLFFDITRKVDTSFQEDLDSELRVLYVAVTRARQNLYLVQGDNGGMMEEVFKCITEEFLDGRSIDWL